MLKEMLNATFLVTFLAASVRMAVPLALAGLGETFSELSGILNIGVEGIMLSGAFFSFLGSIVTGNAWIGMFTGALGGVLISLIHGYLSNRLRADQTISGIALNIFILGLTSFLFRVVAGTSTTPPRCNTLPSFGFPLLGKVPIIGPIFFHQDILAYLTFLLIPVCWFIIHRTTWGLSMKAVGEHPKAADTVGLNVFSLRYKAVIVNGVLSGIGGAYLTLVQLGAFTENLTAGRGFIALAVVIFGKRNPFGVAIAALIFGAADAFQFRLQALGSTIPVQVLLMLPYIVTALVLLGVVGRSEDPAALGKAYVRYTR